MLIRASLELAGPYVVGLMINNVVSHQSFAHLAPFAFLSLGIYLMGLAARLGKDMFELRALTYTFPRTVALATLRSLLALSLGQYKTLHSGVLQSAVDRGQSALRTLLSMLLNELLPFLFQVVPAVIALYYIDRESAGIVLSGLIVFCTLTLIAGKRLIEPMRGVRESQSKDTRFYSDILKNLSLIQLCCSKTRILSEYRIQLEGTAAKAISASRRLLGQNYVILLFLGIVRTLVMLLALKRACAGSYAPGTFIVILMWSGTALNGLSIISSMHRRAAELVSELRDYSSVLLLATDVPEAVAPVQPTTISGRIELRNVSFTYPSALSKEERDTQSRAAPATLENISLEIRAGEKVAFVGRSGAGKTTIAALLSRAYDPDLGVILVDGHDLRTLSLQHYRQSVGFVQQDTTMFDDSLLYNILVGVPDNCKATEHDITSALKASATDAFVGTLDDALETKVGENGKRLSGGQCQRIAIARALIHKRSVLLLDEATSHLDRGTEANVFSALQKHSPASTVIVIAHQVSLMKRVDRIYVLDRGRIVGVGSHDELVSHNIVYQDIIREQSELKNLDNSVNLAVLAFPTS